MMRDEIGRPIELVPSKVRALLGVTRGELLLPMRPQPRVERVQREALVAESLRLGYAPGRSDAELLDVAFREGSLPHLRCPWGRGGDLLWAREQWAPRLGGGFLYASRDAIKGGGVVWRPAASMPRGAARLVLKIDDVGIAQDPDGDCAWKLAVEVRR